MARHTRVDVSSLVEGFDKLSQAKEGIARAMGAAMGVEVRDEAKQRAPVLEPGGEGTDRQIPGTLKRAIYVAFDRRLQYIEPNSYRYTVSWNSKTAAHGHLVEFGFDMPYESRRTLANGLWFTPIPNPTEGGGRQKGIPRDTGPLRIQAQPFLGPAFDAQLPRLMSVAREAGTKKFTESM